MVLPFSSCASAQEESPLPSSAPGPTATPFPFHRETTAPSPTPAPVFAEGYQVHLEENTFLLQKMIYPDPQRDTGLVLAIDGILDERQYFLLAQHLRILDAKTGEERQSFPLSYYNGPFWLTTLSSSMEVSSELVIEDLNFDGYNDFRILTDVGTAGTDVYQYWTWNKSTGQFDKNAELEGLKLRNPEFDAEKQTITSQYADSATDNEIRVYQYIDGKQRMVKWVRYRSNADYDLSVTTTVELQDEGLVVTEEYVEESSE